MLIQVEGTCLFQEKPSGISSYCQNLTKGLKEFCEPEVILPYSRINKYLKHRIKKSTIVLGLKTTIQTFLGEKSHWYTVLIWFCPNGLAQKKY